MSRRPRQWLDYIIAWAIVLSGLGIAGFYLWIMNALQSGHLAVF